MDICVTVNETKYPKLLSTSERLLIFMLISTYVAFVLMCQ